MRPATARARPACTALLLALSLFAGIARAADAGDVFVAGGDVRTGGPIRGDFSAAGGKVLLDEPVAGDAWLTGGSVEVRAPVRDRLRIAAGEALVDGVVGGKLVAAGGKVTVGSDAVIGGGARIYGGRVLVEGRIDGDLHASGRHVTINGEVRGDVVARGDDVELGPDARIAGVLRYNSRGDLRRAEGATVGTIVRQRARSRDRDDDVLASGTFGLPGPWRMAGGVSLLSLLACGAAFLFLVPRYGAQAAERLAGSPLRALTLGIVVALTVPIVAVLLCITVLGIPVGVLLLLAYPVLLLAGMLVAVLALARALAGASGKPQPAGFAATFGWFALALVVVALGSMVPALGGLAVALMVLAGIGAAVMELQRRRRGGAAPGQGRPLETRTA